MTIEQEQFLGLLERFTVFCSENDLHYQISGGTLLGAVRHRGFIPWDDDVDVMMPVEDYRKFLMIESKLPEGLVIQYEKTDPDYPFLFVELCDSTLPFTTKKKHGPFGVFLDIFPIAPSCRPTPLATVCFQVVNVINYVLQVKCGWTSYTPYKKKTAKLGYHILSAFTKKQLRKLRLCMVKHLASDNTEYCFSPGGGHKGVEEFYMKSWIKETVYLDFEGKQVPAPAGWDPYLKRLYGEYMTLPKEEDQKSHHKG